MRWIVFLAWVISLLAAILTHHSLLFSVTTALLTALLFIFPIRYKTREEVALTAKHPLSVWQSPFVYILLLIAAGLVIAAFA